MAKSIRAIALVDISGQPTSLADYSGKVLLIVNVASKCGLTPQYEALQALFHRFRDRGFAVLGFPANDFAGQEPGNDAEIAEFCSNNFGIEFPMFGKIVVTGSDKHPLYAELTALQPEKQGNVVDFRNRLKSYGLTPNEDPEVLWNFEKFLISRDGDVVARFAPDLPPEDPEIVSTIEALLGD